jgi:ubiquitin carboxyl-terminal hydrolase 7
LVGLLNQGATCYLNALLKILFNIQTFQNAILQNTSDSQVILALQKLIGLILLSKRNAVSTKELTTAFGWSNAEVFDQHDALELFSVLIDVIEKEYSEPDTFNKLFRGQQTGSAQKL